MYLVVLKMSDLRIGVGLGKKIFDTCTHGYLSPIYFDRIFADLKIALDLIMCC